MSDDLVLRAEQSQAYMSTRRVPKGEINQPLCPVFKGCQRTGVRPRDEAIAAVASSTPTGRILFAGGATVLLGVALTGLRRRRR